MSLEDPHPKPDGSLDPRTLYLTENEVADRQNRAVKTLRNERLNGRGIPFFKFGRLVRYRLSDVVSYEDARRRNSTSGGDQHS